MKYFSPLGVNNIWQFGNSLLPTPVQPAVSTHLPGPAAFIHPPRTSYLNIHFVICQHSVNLTDQTVTAFSAEPVNQRRPPESRQWACYDVCEKQITDGQTELTAAISTDKIEATP